MNRDLILYIENIIDLRQSFSRISHIDKKSEAMKIWARWIITHRSVCPQGNLVLPDDEVYDTQFILELQDKGVPVKHSYYLHQWLLDSCRRINKNFNPIATYEYGGIHGDRPVIHLLKHKNVQLTCSGIEQSIPISVYNHMTRLYQHNTPVHTTSKYSHKNSYIWLCSTLYNLLDGKGLQWAVPPDVMNLLQTNLCCYTELFASPLNTHNKNYYSLFELDRVFGSKGNFFQAPDTDFESGTYQVNPPFIDPLFTKTTERILELLAIAEQNNRDLTFIYIMPEWSHFTTYYMVSETKYCVRKISLHSGTHYYYQYGSGSYIRARFGTHIFFLSTDSNCCSHTLEREIRHGFSLHRGDY